MNVIVSDDQSVTSARVPERRKAPRKQRFQNLALADFSDDKNRQLMTAALKKVEKALGAEHPLRIGGESVTTVESIISRDPAVPSQIVGRVARAHVEQLERAIRSAHDAQPAWARVSFVERAEVLFRAAKLFRTRRFELSAWMVREAGKSWVEADADTAEAVDFLEFYGREMLRLGLDQPVTAVEGEDNRLDYLPLGVVAVISPWNFPVAILAGMTAAALVTGNSVVLKPSSDTPVVAAKVVEIFEKAGVPPGVLNFVPGSGSEIGDPLVSHPLVRAISFTGSMDVGLRINDLAARTPPGQLWIKRVVLELGGKDAIVVDETADLDLAADGIVAAAFGFQGQKCSSCSRLIAVEAIYDDLIGRVVARAANLRPGSPTDPEADIGPVISDAAMSKILEYIELGREEGDLLLGGNRAVVPGLEFGHFIQPTIFSRVNPGASIAQEEIFGPVLACVPTRDFSDALHVANGTPFGLTGAVYSRSRARLERARQEFHVGNLYLNRKCTGALVGAHPFGGFNRSGTDSKAGGPDYLLHFLQAKLVSEKTGLAPEEE
jgi:1-pyrroline-5-carboxylate dehydrogenase